MSMNHVSLPLQGSHVLTHCTRRPRTEEPTPRARETLRAPTAQCPRFMAELARVAGNSEDCGGAYDSPRGGGCVGADVDGNAPVTLQHRRQAQPISWSTS